MTESTLSPQSGTMIWLLATDGRGVQKKNYRAFHNQSKRLVFFLVFSNLLWLVFEIPSECLPLKNYNHFTDLQASLPHNFFAVFNLRLLLQSRERLRVVSWQPNPGTHFRHGWRGRQHCRQRRTRSYRNTATGPHDPAAAAEPLPGSC
jgi:hypothetical protein